MITMYITSAKAGHEILEYNDIEAALQAARGELDRGRWLYANSDNGMARLSEEDLTPDRFQEVEALFSQPTLQGG